MKYIREGRMGPPKVYKTGAVVSSYPKPMLVLEGDEGGLDVVQAPIVWRTKKELIDTSKEQPPITAYMFNQTPTQVLTEAYKITPDRQSFSDFVDITNALGRLSKNDLLPWKTIVLDPVRILSDIIYGHLAVNDSAQLNDPRKWASSIGLKVRQCIGALNTLKCHTVFIVHSTFDKNELTGVITEEPLIYSKYRDMLGGDLSQFFYAGIENGKPYILTQPAGFVKGIGARWPAGLPAKCGALFNDIYGEAIKRGEL